MDVKHYRFDSGVNCLFELTVDFVSRAYSIARFKKKKQKKTAK